MYLMSFLEFNLYTSVMDKSIHTPQLFYTDVRNTSVHRLLHDNTFKIMKCPVMVQNKVDVYQTHSETKYDVLGEKPKDTQEGLCIAVSKISSLGRTWGSGRSLAFHVQSFVINEFLPCPPVTQHLPPYPSLLEPEPHQSVPRSAISCCSQERPYILSCHQNSRTSAQEQAAFRKAEVGFSISRKLKIKHLGNEVVPCLWMLSEAKNKDSGYVTGEEEDLVFRIRMY